MRFILGVIIGASVGAALGLIAAPQAGKDTRDALATRLRKNTDQSIEGLEEVEAEVAAVASK